MAFIFSVKCVKLIGGILSKGNFVGAGLCLDGVEGGNFVEGGICLDLVLNKIFYF